MNSQFSAALQNLQNQLQRHADAISNAAQLILQGSEANGKIWRIHVEKILAGAQAIFRLSAERLRPTQYEDDRPTIKNEILVIRHELRGLLNNLFGRCDSIFGLAPEDATLLREITFIIDHGKRCVEALDQQRDLVPTEATASEACETSPWTVPTMPVMRRSVATARILVADDDADSRELLGRFVSQMGCFVVFAENGSEALQRAAETSFDIILLDLLMPPPNGLQVLQELSRTDQLDRTFVIIISGLDDASNASLAIRLGAVEVLARPVDFSRLRARIEACLHRQRVRSDREEERVVEIAQAKILIDTFSSSRNATYSTLRVQGFIEQATEMGVGDFFFHYPLSPRQLLAGVGDVTGKGLPAALDMGRFVALIKHTVKNCAPANFADWLVELNNTMYGVIKDGENAAALTVLLFDLETRRVHLAAFAQHFPLRRDYVTGMWNPVPCPRYKLFAHRELREVKVATVCLAAGSHWLLHSDGITEATLTSGKALEQEGVVALLQGGTQWPNYDLSTFVKSWKRSLNGRNEDDATLLLIQNQELPPPLECSGLLTLEKISEVRDFFEQWARFAGLSAEATTPLLVGCDEILNNIFRHAYASESAGQFSCVAVIEPTILRFVIRHSGKGISEVEAQAPIPRRQEGGLGLKLVGHVFSRVHFSAGDSSAGAEIVLEKDLF